MIKMFCKSFKIFPNYLRNFLKYLENYYSPENIFTILRKYLYAKYRTKGFP